MNHTQFTHPTPKFVYLTFKNPANTENLQQARILVDLQALRLNLT